jgi:hypothetical protein
MGTRAAVAGVLALSALTLVGGGGATPTAEALPGLGLVSFDLRTHKERVFPSWWSRGPLPGGPAPRRGSEPGQQGVRAPRAPSRRLA